MERIFAAAFLFYLVEWLKPGNSEDPHYQHALRALQSFAVKSEITNPDGTIRNDVGVVIPLSDMFSKTLSKPTRLVCILNLNAKNTGQAQFEYQPITSSSLPEITTVDEAMAVSLNVAENRNENVTIKSLKGIFVQEYRLGEHNLEWPLFALSHFAQVSFLMYDNDIVVLCLRGSLQDVVRVEHIHQLHRPVYIIVGVPSIFLSRRTT